MSARPTDFSQFVVTQSHGTHGHQSVTSPEDTRASIANDIATGQIERDRVVSVVEFNVSEGWCKDITDDILDDAEIMFGRQHGPRRDPMTGVDFPFAENH